MASITATTNLDITHLDFVLSELERHDFSEAKWEKFGLKCGLYKGRLETLEDDYPNNASKRFRECISRWLRREDGVNQKGKPTLERLADIVKETGDKSTAKKIRSQFKKHNCRGEPGIGKSTLAKELTLRWVRQTDKYLNNYKIIILIPLRFETYQKAKNIEDLLINVDDINETEVMLLINETKGAGVLWILDGFDELPHHLRNSSTSIFIELIKGDILPKSTVIVTSRHAAIFPLLTFLEDDSKLIALKGFGSNEILKYASNYFKNEAVTSEFQSFYSRNTVIENMLYNPMNCFIICKIFTDFTHTNNKNNKHPITMTEIYSYYVRALLKRHLIDAEVIDINYEMPQNLIQEVDFKNSKLIGIWKDFYYLSKLAYDGVMKQEYIFGKELHDIPKLSMMDTISSYYVFDKDESSSFIHTTLQNYFAAIYFINNPHLMFTETDMKQNSNLENVLIFYVGLLKINVRFA
uniref:NACHT domain-containing protein n=1 Tax=Amphimedon queenslandica TaxID=400682 RepID=A0A1X7T407_AMPQE